jgi:uncharacterized protein YndB with AHSA1/START domain
MDILHQFPIMGSASRVFEAITTPTGLDRWWTARSAGTPLVGSTYQLWFGPEYDWRASVTECLTDRIFELKLTTATPDWLGTRVRFRLESGPDATTVHFSHTGWADASDHYRISAFCWAMYLRILKRYIEYGEVVAYDDRLSV